MEKCNKEIKNHKTGKVTSCTFSKHCPIHTPYWKKVWKNRAAYNPRLPNAKELKGLV